MSDLDDAVERIEYAVSTGTQRIAFVTGSGISAPEVPSTAAMVERMLAALNDASVRQQLVGYSISDQYQMMAETINRRRGDRFLARVLREAVLEARLPGASKTSDISIDDQAWRVPSAQAGIAQLYAKLPSTRRGPIFTTNFDPLTEVALRQAHIFTTPLGAPADQPFALEHVYSTVPVVHLHGYWESAATLNTILQLARPRPQIEDMVGTALRDCLVIVIGYGGWDDSFTRALSRMIQGGHLASLNTDILWMQHSPSQAEADSHPLLATAQGALGFTMYKGISASDLLTQLKVPFKVDAALPFVPPGWTGVRPIANFFNTLDVDAGHTPHIGARLFAEGATPEWDMVHELPWLQNATLLHKAVREKVVEERASTVVAVGPTGEGKTTALMQVAAAIASEWPLSRVLWMRAGAPLITIEWLQALAAASSEPVVLVIDEGDLAFDQYAQAMGTLHAQQLSVAVTCVLGMHSHYFARSQARTAARQLEAEVVMFNGISSGDALLVAQWWKWEEILPERFQQEPSQEVAEMLLTAGESVLQGGPTSLFGGVLHLWAGDELQDRVTNLLERLSGTDLAGRSFAQLFAAIAIAQVAWDLDGDRGTGLTLSSLGALCNISSQEVLLLIIEPLGREAGIARSGDRVYTRHPAIAKAVYDETLGSAFFRNLVRLMGYAGGRLRMDPEVRSQESNPTYNLSRKLYDLDSLSAALGAIEGASKLLEPRVTYMACARKMGRATTALNYASILDSLAHTYRDQHSAYRGFLVEWAVCELAERHPQRALALLLHALSDTAGSSIKSEQVRYVLVNICRVANSLIDQSVEGADRLYATATQVLIRLPGGLDAYQVHVRRRGLPTTTTTERSAILYEDLIHQARRLSSAQEDKQHWTYRKLFSCLVAESSVP